MGGYKHIEECIFNYISKKYQDVVEIGIGNNFEVASCLLKAGLKVLGTDVVQKSNNPPVPFAVDDIFEPETGLYMGADLLYAIRPGPEMVPPAIDLAKKINCDLLVYHLGNEIYGDGGRIVDCDIVLHCYHTRV